MEHDWKGQIAIAVVLIGVAIAGWYFFAGDNSGRQATTIPDENAGARYAIEAGDIQAAYACDESKSIVAIFREGQVHLVLSDGREMTVPQAISASGVRFANADESFVFWNKEDTAFIDEGGNMAYTNCSETQ